MDAIIQGFAILLPYCFIMAVVSNIWTLVVRAFKGGIDGHTISKCQQSPFLNL